MSALAPRPELTGVLGVPETLLDPDSAASLPAHEAPAPWRCRCSAVAWVSRRRPGTPVPGEERLGRLGPLVAGALVAYHDTPVGAYAEALALVTGRSWRPWGTVPFMAVDSERSLVGGRTNWSLPKTTATVTGRPGVDARVVARGAATDWTVEVTARPFGPALPVRAGLAVRQVFPDGRVGTCRMSGRGRLRLAWLTVRTGSEAGVLAGLLGSGRRLGAVVEESWFTLGTPRFDDD